MTGAEFHLLRPLWLLALLPLAVLLWRLLRSAGEGQAWRGVVDAHLLPHLLSGVQGRAQRLPLWLLTAAWLLLVLALAGPTWERLPEPLYQARQFRVVVLDLSPSMNATDLAPSRLVRARFKVLDLLRQFEEGQTALLAYGAEPYVVSPLTTDVKTIAAQVPSLDTSLLPVAGARRTDLALDQAAELLRQAGAPEGEVILVTDGEENTAAANAAAARLRASGYRVSVLGVGTLDGSPVRSRDGGFLKDASGAIRVSRLQETALRDLAAAGGGVYVTASPGDGDIALLRPGTPLAPGAQDEEQTTQTDRWREEGPVLLVLLLPLAAFAFRRGWLSPLLLLVCVLPPDAEASLWDDLWQRPDQRATRLLEDGRATQAAELFQRPDWRAAARYRAGDYEQSLQALDGLEGPVAAYDRALAADPGHADARHNRALLQRLMEQRQQREEAPDRPMPRDETSPQAQQEQDAEDQVAAEQASAGQSEDSEQQAAESNEDPGESQGQGQAEQQSSAGESAQQASGGEDSGESQPESAQADGEAGQQDAQPSTGQAGGDQSQGAQQAAGEGAQDDQSQQATAGQAAGEQPQGEQQAADQGAQADQAQQSPAAPAIGEDGQEAAASQTAEPKGPEGDQEPQQASAGAEPNGESSPDNAAPPGDQGESPGEDAASAQQAQAGDRGDDGDPQERDGGAVGQGSEDPAGQDDSRPAQAEGATGSGDQADQMAAAAPRSDADSAAPPAGATQSPGMADLLGDRPGSQSGRGANEQMSMMSPEDRQAVEQMLRRVEDDPAALLRQRFLLQHLRRSGQLP